MPQSRRARAQWTQSASLASSGLRSDLKLRKLQGADVGDNRPTVGWRHAVAVGIHRSVTAGDGVKKQLRRRRAQLRVVERRRVRKAARDDDAIPVTVKPMARGTENTETLAPARDRRCCDRGRVDC